MEQLRLISDSAVTNLSASTATLVAVGSGAGQGVLVHNPILGSRVGLTLLPADAAAPTAVSAANQLFSLAGGATLTLNLGAELALYAQCDVSGGQVNAARIGD